jgi:hypothetical protein
MRAGSTSRPPRDNSRILIEAKGEVSLAGEPLHRRLGGVGTASGRSRGGVRARPPRQPSVPRAGEQTPRPGPPGGSTCESSWSPGGMTGSPSRNWGPSSETRLGLPGGDGEAARIDGASTTPSLLPISLPHRCEPPCSQLPEIGALTPAPKNVVLPYIQKNAEVMFTANVAVHLPVPGV